MNNTTLKDIAKVAGVSVTTVSKVLKNHEDISEKTKNVIRNLCREMNYIPNTNASNLRKKTSNLISIMICNNSNPFYDELIKSVQEELTKNGFISLIYISRENEDMEQMYIRQLKGLNVSGVLITPASEKSILLLRDLDIPYVLLGRYVDKEKDSYVVPDDEQGGYLATKHCLDQNPHAPVYLFLAGKQVSTSQELCNGYCRALEEKNIKLNFSETIFFNAYDNYNASQIADKIIKKAKPPYSFVCESDFVASGVIKALQDARIKIPEEAKVVGIDNLTLFSFMHPQLTTIDIQIQEIGKSGVNILRSMISKKKRKQNASAKHVILPVKLIKREST